MLGDARLPARPPVPRDLRDAGARDRARRARRRASARARRRSSRSCTRSSASREELRRLRELTVRVAAEEARARLPRRHDDRAAARVRPRRRDRRARRLLLVRHERPHADGARVLARRRAGKFLTHYLETGVLERNPFETLDQDGVGDLMQIAVERGRRTQAGHQARHLRRARGRAAVGRVLPPARARLRLVLARTACRSRGSPPRRRRSPRRASSRSRSAADG